MFESQLNEFKKISSKLLKLVIKVKIYQKQLVFKVSREA